MHRVMIVPVCLSGLLLPPRDPAVQAYRWAVLAFVVRTVVVRGRPAWWIPTLVPRTVRVASQVERTGPGLVVRTGEAGTPVGVGMDRERRAGHVESGSICAWLSQEVPGVELQAARHQIGGGLGQAFTQHLHIGHHIWTFPVA